MIRAFFYSRSTRRTFFWTAFALWASLLWFLSAQPGDGLPPLGFAHIDKVAHFTYYFCGAVILILALWNSTPWRGWKSALLALIIIGLVGIVDEWHQLYVPFRSGGDPYDWSADCLGGLAAVLVLGWGYGEAKRRKFCGQGK